MKQETIEQRILNALLDKYERSSSYKENRPSSRRILIYFYASGKSDFTFYDIENSERRISVNRAVEKLEKESLVFFKWMAGEHRHIIKEVWLNTDFLLSAYSATGRKPKGDEIDNICRKLEKVIIVIKTKWVCEYLQDVYDYMIQWREIPAIIPKDSETRDYLICALVAIDKLDGIEIMERVFSLQVYGNTKIFESVVKSRIISILRKYNDNVDVNDDDVLKQIGIVKYPEQFEFCGKMSIIVDGGVVDYRFLPGGGVVYSSDFVSGKLCIDPSVTSIISIENRANYIDYIRKVKTENEVVIYHGGQFSPCKKVFLKAIANAMPNNCIWHHWSDIDYGGFIMLLRIRREIVSKAIAYRMDSIELERYRDFASCIKPKYAEKLRSLKDKEELSDCYECVDYMLQNQVRLEQEAMLTDTKLKEVNDI